MRIQLRTKSKDGVTDSGALANLANVFQGRIVNRNMHAI